MNSLGLRKFLKRIFPPQIINLLNKIRNLFFYEFVLGPLTYNQDGLATRLNCDFMKDEKFITAYKLGKNTGSWGSFDIHWRAYICCWAANRAKNIQGDFVECGVNKGGLALTVMTYVDFKNLSKRFYLLDTFGGLADKYISDDEKKSGIDRENYKYEKCYDFVKETFKEFSNVEIIKGPVPDTLPLVKAEKISYLSIDMNCALPEIAAAEFFWDKLTSGAIMILDDYGCPGHIMQKKAFDKFAVEKYVQVLSLPTGQGLIFKP